MDLAKQETNNKITRRNDKVELGEDEASLTGRGVEKLVRFEPATAANRGRPQVTVHRPTVGT